MLSILFPFHLPCQEVIFSQYIDNISQTMAHFAFFITTSYYLQTFNLRAGPTPPPRLCASGATCLEVKWIALLKFDGDVGAGV